LDCQCDAGFRRARYADPVEGAVTQQRPPEGGATPPTSQQVIDTSVAHQSRIYDYWPGGKDNFAVDREAAELAIAAYPPIVRGVRAQRAFLARAVRYLAEQQGIRQFLDIGTGLPTANNTHEVAQAAAPTTRVVYVDNDPMVLTHARALLTSTPHGATSYVDADLRQPDKILAAAADLLDFSQPVAVLLIGILQLIPDADQPHAIVAHLVAAMPRGSWLAVYHPASDIDQNRVGDAVRRVNARSAGTTTLRSYDQVARFFDGLVLTEPGLVQVQRWRPGAAAPDDGEEIAAYAGLGQKS
jgi:O-methyltransferase involved in polyketide biosynthesis